MSKPRAGHLIWLLGLVIGIAGGAVAAVLVAATLPGPDTAAVSQRSAG